MALAYFITFSTYGTWLHGSEKGSVDRQHNVYGEAVLMPNSALKEYRRKLMKQEPYALNAASRKIVLKAIQDHTTFRDWFLWAAHVRTNHVHIVVGTGDETKSPERMMTELKAHASRDINAARIELECEHWTRHGSTRHLHTEDEINQAIYYTVYEQGESMEVYIDPTRAQHSARTEPRT